MGFSWIEVVTVTAIVLILVAVGWGVYSESQRPTIEIKKDDWECVKWEQRTHLQPILIGKMTIMQPMTNTICVEYRRRDVAHIGR